MANLDARKPAPASKVVAYSTADGKNATPPGADPVARVFHSLILPELTRTAGAGAAQAPAEMACDGRDVFDVAAFCDLLTQGNFEQAVDFMDASAARGGDRGDFLLEMLAAAARQLGMDWERDACGFGDVTIGMSRLHQVLQHLAMETRFQPSQLIARGRALLAPCPGEQHNFGVMILDHVFHRAGWDLRTLPSSTEGQLSKIASASRFDVVGLSLSCDEQLPRLEQVISTLRRASRNQDVVILVGGRVFAEDASLARRIGADAAPPKRRRRGGGGEGSDGRADRNKPRAEGGVWLNPDDAGNFRRYYVSRFCSVIRD